MDIEGPKYFIHRGHISPFGFSRDALDSALDFQPKDGTIIICTYPRCGTTWMQHIVYLLLHAGKPFPTHLKISSELAYLEFKGAEHCANSPMIKTHLSAHSLHLNKQAKYIVVARNPKDCCVSYYHHNRGFPQYFDYIHGTFDDFFERFLNGKVACGDYFDYFVSWEPYLNDPNVFFCTYEQLIRDTKEVAERLAAFIGTKIDDNILKDVLHHSSFQSMKTDPQRWSTERPKDMPSFIRKGEIGDWRNYFTQEQSDRMNKKIEQFPLVKQLWAEYM